MLRNALFALGASLTIGLPQHAVAQNIVVESSIQPVVVRPVAVQPVAVQPVAIRPVAVQRVVVRSVEDERCYDPDRDGERNNDALPLCAGYLEQAAGGEQYATIDRSTLANTQACRPDFDCGIPADLTEIRSFYKTAGQQVAVPAPQPVVLAPSAPTPPAPVVVASPPVPAAIPPVPPAFSALPALPGAGMAGIGYVAAGVLTLAAVAGVVALANNDSSTGTR